MRINRGKIMNSAITILSIMLVLLCIRFAVRYTRQSQNYYASEDIYLHYIGNKEYHQIVNLNQNNQVPKNASDTLIECMAVADYYKNTSLYKAYEQAGDSQKAQKYYRKMDENKEKMGDLSYTAEEILQELNEIIDRGISN